MNILSLLIFVIGILIGAFVFHRLLKMNIDKKVYYSALFSMLFVALGFFISFFIFSSSLSLAMIAFSSLLLLPFNIKMIKKFESKSFSRRARNWSDIMKRHDSLIRFYLYLFFGMVVMYTILFILLPPVVGDVAFQNQMQLTGPSGYFFNPELFFEIVGNNFVILITAFVLSIFYGAGSLYVLNYNASIIGVLYGGTFRAILWGVPALGVINPAAFLPHTILEIVAYLLAAVAGGILSKYEMTNKVNRGSLLDSGVIFSLSLFLIVLAAYVELTIPLLLI